MLLSKIRHSCPESDGFRMARPRGHDEYTILLFQTPVAITLDNQALSLPAGTCMIYPPDMPQYYQAQGPMVHSWLHISNAAAPLLSQYQLPVGVPFQLHDTLNIINSFQMMQQEFSADDPYREDLLDHWVQMFLILLSRSVGDTAPLSSVNRSDHRNIREVRQQVLSMPQKKWTVAEMAAMASLSPSRFHDVYRSVFGTSPLRDVIEAKVEYAKSLLLTQRDLPLPQVAELLGYNDQYHFIRQFRTQTGITPGAYRKANPSQSE